LVLISSVGSSGAEQLKAKAGVKAGMDREVRFRRAGRNSVDGMTQDDAKLVSLQQLYTMAALELMRARIEDLRSKGNDASAILFLGRNFTLVEALHRRWDALPEPRSVPRPCDIWSWL
jgi:hypothetical protein